MAAMGNDPDKLDVDIIQMVRLVRNGEEVKMSKRLGNAWTIMDLVDLVGVDAARYIFRQQSPRQSSRLRPGSRRCSVQRKTRFTMRSTRMHESVRF